MINSTLETLVRLPTSLDLTPAPPSAPSVMVPGLHGTLSPTLAQRDIPLTVSTTRTTSTEMPATSGMKLGELIAMGLQLRPAISNTRETSCATLTRRMPMREIVMFGLFVKTRCVLSGVWI